MEHLEFHPGFWEGKESLGTRAVSLGPFLAAKLGSGIWEAGIWD